MVLVSFAAVTVLGSYGETRNFPIYTLFILSGSNVYYRFDYIVVAIWVAVSLVRAAVYLLLATRMLGELMGYQWGKWMMAVNGILVQLPVPKHIDEDKIIKAISPLKDVDGFHPMSVGALSIGQPGFVSCTPAGVIQLLKRSGIVIAGKECVVIGRSNIVGKPMAMLLLRENGTVTICHSKTKDLKEVCKRADILVVAIGRPKMIDASYIKEGATVIDVGIHRDENNKLCGDVDFESASKVAGAITPVPGGVGPMTIAMLMHNCVDSINIK